MIWSEFRRRYLCRIGWHRWLATSEELIPGKQIMVVKERCKYCDKRGWTLGMP